MTYKLTVTRTTETTGWTLREWTKIGDDADGKSILGYPDQVKEITNETTEIISLVLDNLNVNDVVNAALGLK